MIQHIGTSMVAICTGLILTIIIAGVSDDAWSKGFWPISLIFISGAAGMWLTIFSYVIWNKP